MKIEIKFTDDEARRVQYFLRKRYENKAGLPRLAKTAIRETVRNQAVKDFGDLLGKADEEVRKRIKALL